MGLSRSAVGKSLARLEDQPGEAVLFHRMIHPRLRAHHRLRADQGASYITGTELVVDGGYTCA
jgi:hypothetical protein